MMHSVVDTWGLIERRGKRGDTRYTLSAEGIRYVTHRDRAQLSTTQGIWSTALTTDKQGRRRHVGHRIETWARQTKHADGVTWFQGFLESDRRFPSHLTCKLFGRSVVERAVGPDGIVVVPPALHDGPGRGKAHEPVLVEALVTQQ